MPWPMRSFIEIAHSRHFDACRLALNEFWSRIKDQIDSFPFAKCEIVAFGSRIARKIFVGTKLQRVNENGDRHLIVFSASGANKRCMPLVKRAHRRHEAETA